MTQNLDIIRKLKQHSKVENKKPLPVTSVSTAQYNPPQTTSTINVQVNVQQPQPQVQIPPSQQKIYYTQTSDKSKSKAFKLCLFFGILGFHYFYVGRIGKGLLYLVTLGLLGFGWLADLLVISLGTFRDNVGVPLRQ